MGKLQQRWESFTPNDLKDRLPERARLIAAAPELLQALNYCLPLLKEWNDTIGSEFEKDALLKATTAINKATQGD